MGVRPGSVPSLVTYRTAAWRVQDAPDHVPPSPEQQKVIDHRGGQLQVILYAASN